MAPWVFFLLCSGVCLIRSDWGRIGSCHTIRVGGDGAVSGSDSKQERVCGGVPVTELGYPACISFRIIYRAWAVPDVLHAQCGRKSGIREPCDAVVGSEHKGKIGVVYRTGAGGKLCINSMKIFIGIVPTYAILNYTCNKSILCFTVTSITTIYWSTSKDRCWCFAIYRKSISMIISIAVAVENRRALAYTIYSYTGFWTCTKYACWVSSCGAINSFSFYSPP